MHLSSIIERRWAQLFPPKAAESDITSTVSSVSAAVGPPKLQSNRLTVPVTFHKPIIDLLWGICGFAHYPERSISSSVPGYATVRHEQADVAPKCYPSEEERPIWQMCDASVPPLWRGRKKPRFKEEDSSSKSEMSCLDAAIGCTVSRHMKSPLLSPTTL